MFKSGDKTMLTNYRPLSALSLFSKIFEKLMYNYLLDFININNILYKIQFGVRKQYSTSHTIISLADRMNNV